MYYKDLELHTIELKKFSSNSKEDLSDIVAKVNNALDMWSAFLTRNDLLTEDNLPKKLNSPDLKKAINVLNVMNFTDEEREAYEDHLKWLRIEANTLKKAEEKGANSKALEIVHRMLQENTDIKFISSVTGLSTDEILKLKNKL